MYDAVGCKNAHTLPLIIIMIVADLFDTCGCVETLTNEKDQDGWDGVAYLDDDSDSEVDPLSSGEYEGDENSNEDEDGSDEDNKEVRESANTNRKQCGHLIGKMILWGKRS